MPLGVQQLSRVEATLKIVLLCIPILHAPSGLLCNHRNFCATITHVGKWEDLLLGHTIFGHSRSSINSGSEKVPLKSFRALAGQ